MMPNFNLANLSALRSLQPGGVRPVGTPAPYQPINAPPINAGPAPVGTPAPYQPINGGGVAPVGTPAPYQPVNFGGTSPVGIPARPVAPINSFGNPSYGNPGASFGGGANLANLQALANIRRQVALPMPMSY
jgi:hypothetical protein